MPDLTGIVERLQVTLGSVSEEPVPLEGGITNRNYKVRLGSRDYMVRLPGKDTALLGISREAERIGNSTAARLGIAPALAVANDECLVAEYLRARPLEPREVSARSDEVAAALRAFHDSGTQLPARFWVPELLESYAEIVLDRGGSLPREYGLTQALADRIAKALPLSDPVPCHDDLLPANILLTDQRIVLVDWEYAAMGHRLFDLGNLAVNNEFDERAEERMLLAYWGEPPTPGRTAALKLMKIMSDAREAAWGVLQGVISELDFDFAGYAQKHFDRLAGAASDPKLEEWLDAAAA
jgi:thiamine kinase-like enzyme